MSFNGTSLVPVVVQAKHTELFQVYHTIHLSVILDVIFAQNLYTQAQCLILIISDGKYLIPALVTPESVKEQFSLSTLNTTTLNNLRHKAITIRQSSISIYRRGNYVSPYMIALDWEKATDESVKVQHDIKDILKNPKVKRWIQIFYTLELPKDEPFSHFFQIPHINRFFPRFDQVECILEKLLAACFVKGEWVVNQALSEQVVVDTEEMKGVEETTDTGHLMDIDLSVTTEELVNKEQPVHVEEPVRVEDPVRVEEPVRAEEPVRVEEPVHTEQSVLVEEPVCVEEPVYTEETVHTEQAVHIEQPVRVEEPVHTEQSVLVEEPVCVEEPVRAEKPVHAEESELVRTEQSGHTEEGQPIRTDQTLHSQQNESDSIPLVGCMSSSALIYLDDTDIDSTDIDEMDIEMTDIEIPTISMTDLSEDELKQELNEQVNSLISRANDIHMTTFERISSLSKFRRLCHVKYL